MKDGKMLVKRMKSSERMTEYLSIYRICDYPLIDVIDLECDWIGYYITRLNIDDDPKCYIDYLPDNVNFSQTSQISLYQVEIFLKKLPFSFSTCSFVLKCYKNVEMKIKDYEISLFSSQVAAKKIQKCWRYVISNPSFDVCKRRLRNEFNEMVYDFIKH